jgi:hypothetical protein
MATHRYLAHLVGRGWAVDVIAHLASHGCYVLDGVTVHPGTADIEDADVVVAHAGDSSAAVQRARARGAPVVTMVHGYPVKNLDGSALVVFNSHASRDAAEWAGEWIVARPPTVPGLYRTTPGERVTLVNCSVDKGGDIFWVLARALPNVDFLGVRGGYGSQKVRHADNVTYVPSTDDMRSVYSQTRVLLMPSKRETWGMTAVEAMASGIPVIANPTDGLRESLGDAGIFCDRTVLAPWREAVLRLHDPDEWHAASEKALKRSAELYEQTLGDLETFIAAIGRL